MKYSCVSWSQSWHRKLKPEDCAAECADNELFGGAMSEVQFHVLLIHVGMQIVCPWIWLLPFCHAASPWMKAISQLELAKDM